MDNNKNVESNALSFVPMEERMSWISMAFVQAGICVCVPSFLLGAILAETMPLGQAIWSGTIGNLIVVLVMTITGLIGTDLGYATCTVSQAGFGVKGARIIVSTIFAVSLLGWFGIQNGVCGEAFSNLMYLQYGISIPVWISSVGWGLVMLATAVFGLGALEKLDKASIPFLMAVILIGVVFAARHFGLGGLNSDVEQTMSFGAGVGLAFNFFAVGAITGPDFARFQKTRKDTIKSTFWGIFPMGQFTLILGIVLTSIAMNYDISLVLIEVGLPLFGIAALILSTWTTNSTNAYCAGLNIIMTLGIPDNRRREATLIAGIIGTVLGVMGILYHIEGFLSILSFISTPIGGVMMADYWIIGKGKASNFRPVEGMNWAGVIAWIIGGLLAYYFQIEYLGIFTGFVVYLMAERFIPSSSREGFELKNETVQ